MKSLTLILLLALLAAPISAKLQDTIEFAQRGTRESPVNVAKVADSADRGTGGGGGGGGGRTGSGKRLDGIALFMLATTKPFRQISSLESRIVPISQTWTTAFDAASVYYVMGTNYFDYSYLQKRCVLQRIEGDGIAPEQEVLAAGETNASADMRSRNGITKARRATIRGRRLQRNDSVHVGVDWERASERRRLKPQSKQRKSENRRLLYSCDYEYLLPEDQELRNRPHTFSALFTANCTGEYFGYGPACRYQEAMRFFLYHRRMPPPKGAEHGLFANTEWFVFMDDDLYIRPFSLQTLLNSLSLWGAQFLKRRAPAIKTRLSDVHPTRREPIRSSEPMAMIQSELARGFEFSKKWNRTTYNCKVGGVHDLYLSMPAILNVAAMDTLQAAVDANAVTEAQERWGGTHDMLVGLILWMHSIPIFSMASSYFGGRAFFEQRHMYAFEPAKHIFVHSTKNMQIFNKPTQSPTDPNVLSLYSMYDVAVSFQDCQAGADSDDVCARYERGNGTHRFSSGGGVLDLTSRSVRPEFQANASYTTREAMIEGQAEMGLKAFHGLFRLPFSYINVTVFAKHAKTLSSTFVHFKPEHCDLDKALVKDSDLERVSGRFWVYKKAVEMDTAQNLGTAFGAGIFLG